MRKGSSSTKKSDPTPPKVRLTMASPLLFVPSVALVGWMVYSACTGFGVTNWDDNHYIRELLLIRSLAWDNIVLMFKTKVLLSYNPLTILSLAMDYQWGGNSPAWYHGMNVALHLVDTVLVYFVIRKLFKMDTLAATAGLLFAVHPMHVEAVAWIACRKDVLYAFFFLSSWWAYLAYADLQPELRGRRGFLYALSFVLFLASGFSKVQAVTLPLVLLLSDYAQSGDWRWKRQLDKLPFLAGAFAFGWYAVSSSSLAADQYAEPVSFLQRVVYSFQAFSLYVTDSVIPFRQSAITPFPTAESGNYLLLLVSGILIATAMLYLVVRHLRSHPAFVFGLLFFMVNIFPTLHVIGLNSSLIYDRFTYLAYIGLFVAIMRSPWPSSWSVNRKTAILAMSAVPFSLLAYQRTLVWKSSLTLWNDVLEKHPRTHEARNNRGASFNEIGQLDRALEDFNASLEVNPNQPRTLNNRSMIWFRKADYTRSLQDAEKALEMEPRLAEAWCNRGNAYFGRQQYDTAILYYNRAIELMPNFPSNYCNRGTAYLKQGDFQKAVEDYLQSISQAPDYVEAWRLLGLAYAELDEHDKAIAAAEKARSLDPRSDSYQVLSKEYLDMGIKAWKSSKDGASEGLNAAIAYFEKALAVNPNNADALEELGGMWFMKRDVVKARDFWRKALALDPKLERARQGLEHTGGI